MFNKIVEIKIYIGTMTTYEFFNVKDFIFITYKYSCKI